MIRRFKSSFRRHVHEFIRECSHGEMIDKLLLTGRRDLRDNLVFVETGCGGSTIALSKCARELNAVVYSLDYDTQKVNDLKSRFGERVANVEFVVGDSLENLPRIVAKHRIDFLFLDSAASAMHTFREFRVCESAFRPGSCLLVDNAALPGAKRLLSPVRKGKILVPYLLASPYWDVSAHPRAGDSMISAVLQDEPRFADPAYEHPEYVTNWGAHLAQASGNGVAA